MRLVNNPNIVTCHEYFEAEGDVWIVMELCKGRDLYHGYIDPNFDIPIPQEEVLKIIHQLALGLQAIHGENIYHRDLKAGNIVLTEDGVIKICDFGLAKDMTPLAHIPGRTVLSY